MLASSTQQTFVDDEAPSAARAALLRSISVLDPNDFHNFLQEHYGACWGTLKFEDSLSDYSNDVSRSSSLLSSMKVRSTVHSLLLVLGSALPLC